MSAADASGERPAQPCATCAHAAIALERSLSVERQLSHLKAEVIRHQHEARFRPLVAALSIVGAATVIVALVCLAVLALRLAGGVR